ncbi:hypothetical protein ACHAWT_005738 [Skeletonema menzelii]
MIEALEQTAWSIRLFLQQEYDSRKKNNNSPIILLTVVILPILSSYIIAQQQHSKTDGDTIASYILNALIGGLANFLLNLWQAILRIVGITLGIGLGLGLAGHVYDVLSDAQLDIADANAAGSNNDIGNAMNDRGGTSSVSNKNNKVNSNSKPNFKEYTTSSNTFMEDTNSYHSLMRSAGYTVDNGMLRAQMVRGEQAVNIQKTANDAKRDWLLGKKDELSPPTATACSDLNKEEDNEIIGRESKQPSSPHQKSSSRLSIYKFDKGTNASTQMRRMWPNLSPLINDSLAKLTEFVLRDYVSSWYAKVDDHVVFDDPSSVVGEVVDGTSAATMGAAVVERQELLMSSNSREGNANRPSTAPPVSVESMTKRREAMTTTPPSFEVGTVASTAASSPTASSTRGGGIGLVRSTSELSSSTTRPRTSQSVELQSSLTSVASSAAGPASDPRIFQSTYSPANSHDNLENNNTVSNQPQQQRTMVLTTTGTQSSPFIDSLYTAFAYLLGMLATRSSENVNILELLLLHFPHILAQNLRVYREMKQVALEKKRRRVVAEREKWRRGQMEAMREVRGGGGGLGGSISSGMASLSGNNSNNNMNNMPTNSEKELESTDVSEIAIIREYLQAGRLHAALTFGMDVPSLLFADPLGKDCPPGPSHQENNDSDRQRGHTDEDSILENRLLSPESSLIAECELDYNRVLASKVAKLVVSKNEIDSSVVRTMLVEMLASCVLCPTMGCFTPDYVNGWLITGLSLLEDGGAEGESPAAAAAAASTAKGDETVADSAAASDKILRGDSQEAIVCTNQSVVSDLDGHAHDSLSGLHPVNSGESDDKTQTLDSIVDGVVEEIITSDGSVRSEMDELFEEEYVHDSMCNDAEQIITLLSMSIIELGRFIDFEDCRYARARNEDILVDWDQSDCRRAVKHLVLVIEAALLLGARSERKRSSNFSVTDHDDLSVMEQDLSMVEQSMEYDDDFEVEIYEKETTSVRAPSTGHQHATLSAALMELTGDIDSFEKLILDSEQDESADDASIDDGTQNSFNIPKPNELSTLRTLIAAWLHTGQAFKVLSIIAHAKKSILVPFYHGSAFVRRENYVNDFTRLLRQLDGVEILVDTHSVLASQCILVGNGFDILMQSFQNDFGQKQDDPFPQRRGRSLAKEPLFSMVGSMRAKSAQNFSRIARFAQSASESFHIPFDETSSSTNKRPFSANIAFQAQNNNHSTPAYLDFNKNSTFASSLRSERDRRHESWVKEISGIEKIEFFCRARGIKDKDAMVHRELHHLSRFFYAYTSEMRIEPCPMPDAESGSSEVAANITVKGVSSRRKLEVPDEDSSFLLRVQAKPLKPAGVHRDQRNPNLACKIYFAMYEEPAIHPKTKRFYGGRYLRQCLLKYYPSDRTASVSVSKDISTLDGRVNEISKFVLTEEFQKLRHACLKVAVGGILSSPLMEPTDFAATPRTGKALDFVYRSSLFGRPIVDLGGKKFIVHDAASHRADASALELSDASMSAAIIARGACGLNVSDSDSSTLTTNFNIQVSADGTPIVLLRANKSNNNSGSPTKEGTEEEARPYRPSFIRAALYIKSAKQEAQLLCLNYCIRGGSARSSAKLKSDEWLQPTLILLQYANSRRQEQQSVLLRDLRLGMNHIDRGQLSRNGLLNPRYPTILRGLNTSIIGTVEAKAPSEFDLLSPSIILYKIRCTAIAEYIGVDEDDDLAGDKADTLVEKKGRTKARYFREEWTVLRSLRDFSVFHKHIKGQVAQTESSGNTGTKLAGVASSMVGNVTSALGGANSTNQRERGPLVPSLSHATKVGALPGLSTKKVTERRKKLLDEYLQYLVSPNNLLSQCPELLKFLGAYTPIFPVGGNAQLDDSYGREDIKRVELVTEKLKVGIVEEKHSAKGGETVATPVTKPVVLEAATPAGVEPTKERTIISKLEATPATTRETPTSAKNNYNSAAKRLAVIRAGEIRLKEVRRSIFRLLRYMFDLDNASFFRSRVISVLKTMSVAVASAQDFQTMLSQMHLKYMNGEWISGWIYYLVDMFWPDGVFYTKAPDLTEGEQLDLKRNSKKILEKMFPDQLKTVLGKHTESSQLHEMLQNRVVLKSMAYMIMDLVWAEIFPELGDFVTGAESLEKES